MKKVLFRTAGCFMLLGLCAVWAEEGMWTFDNPPAKALSDKYGFVASQEWLDHVRLSSVRFMDGGSGAFISPNGLVMTNHHVAMGQLQKISTTEKNYVQTGFFASRPEEEIQSPDLEVNVLVSMKNVTDEVRASIPKGLSEMEALKAQKAAIARIEKASLDQTGLKSEVVTLYQGGEFWLYCNRKYTDVRLVMAPERQAAYYGGDDDNFTYPRFDLDMAFFRVYENGKPLRSEHFFKWNAAGAREGELVFVTGNPGRTNRLYTLDQLKFQRDLQLPLTLLYFDRRLDILYRFSGTGAEQSRRALNSIFGIENSKKSVRGEYEGLLDPSLFRQKGEDEAALRKLIRENGAWKKAFGGAWDAISSAVEKQRSVAKNKQYRQIIGSRMASFATDIVLYAREIVKPDAERLESFHDSKLEALRFRLFSRAPIYRDLEIFQAVEGLKLSVQELGQDDPYLSIVLDRRTPEESIKPILEKTRLNEPDFRRSLIEGGRAAVEQCDDPLVVLVRKLEPVIRTDIEWSQKNVESVLNAAGEKIARARFAAYGKSTYPDATFTPRLSYGAVKGYPMNGTIAPCKTTLYGLFDRALSFDRKGDFELPARFWERKDALDLSTPVNFVCSCDIIGGNSGSPVIDRNAGLVGLVFDGNIESLPGRFIFDETRNRTVSVHSAYILEALRKLYDAGSLADEIEGK
jgi:hypothetical protein